MWPKKYGETLDRKRKPVDEAKFEKTTAKVFVENAEETLARPASYANVEDAELELKGAKLKLQDAEKRYTEMKEELDPFKNNLKIAQIHVQGNMEEALQGVGLLDPSARQEMDHSYWRLQDTEARFEYRHIEFE